MIVTYKNLLAAGIVLGEPVKKTISFPFNGEQVEGDIYIRKPSPKAAVEWAIAQRDGVFEAIVARVAGAVVDENGDPAFPVEALLREKPDGDEQVLPGEMVMAIIMAVTEYYNGEKKPLN